jgi:hypothetical protein
MTARASGRRSQEKRLLTGHFGGVLVHGENLFDR